jgi:hypothetical protein
MTCDKKLNIGDKIYKKMYLKGVATYEVIGIRKYANSNHYEIKCLSCAHGYNCKILILAGEKKEFLFIEMLNDCQDEPQKHWHNDAPYFLTELGCFIHKGKEILNENDKEIKSVTATLEKLMSKQKELKDYIDSLNKKLEEQNNAMR